MIDCSHKRNGCEKCVGKFIDTYKIFEISCGELKFDHRRYPVCSNYSAHTNDPSCYPLEDFRLDDFKMSNIVILNGVDPVGNIIFSNNKVYRGIHKQYVNQYSTIYNICHQNGLLGQYIIDTKIADDFSLEPFGLIFEHELVWPYIYPFEWSLSMLIDAAYTLLHLVTKLDVIGLGLKDGHPYNIAYNKGIFCFIDFGSIIPNRTTLWMFKEFINTFVNWIICKTKGIGQNTLLIEENISSHLTSEEQKRYNLYKTTILEHATSGEVSKAIGLLYHWIKTYELKHEIVAYDSKIPESILNSIITFTKEAQIKHVLLASGNFTNIIFALNQHNIAVTVFNEDPNYMDFIYTQIKQKETSIAPALIDFLNPNGPNDGSRWFNAEIRFSSEMVIVLNQFLTQTDFVTLSRNLKLFMVRYAAIEIAYPLNQNLIEAIRQDFDIIDLTKESYDGKKLIFVKIK